MQIRSVTTSDIPVWEALSSEYDGYVKELVGDLKEWYEGNDDSLAFSTYMESKIIQQEAFIALDSANQCLGIIAFSKRNNRITFFGISHKADLSTVGQSLLLYAFEYLDSSKNIYINEIASHSEWIEQHRKLFSLIGFIPAGDALENGVPVDVFLKAPANL